MKMTNKMNAERDRAGQNQQQKLQELLMLEAAIRQQKSPEELAIWAVNELQDLLDFSQSVVFRLNNRGAARVMAISGLSDVNREAPFVRWIESLVAENVKGTGQKDSAGEIRQINLAAENHAIGDENGVYAFRHGLVVPLADFDGQVFGVWLLARSSPWAEGQITIAGRLGETTSHAFQTLLPKRRLRSRSISNRWRIGLPVLLALALFIPVPMTTLAPAEIIADEPFVVAAPLDGVVSEIAFEANSTIKAGDVLFEYENTEVKAAAEVARRKELVAVARLATARQAAFGDAGVYRQLAIAKAEVNLSQAERGFADKRLARSIVRAPRSGLLIYSGRRDLIGKPVKTGERVMEIADTGKVTIRIDLPVADAIALQNGAKVRLFLDANPLNALTARLRHASYSAREVAGVGLVYRIIADIEGTAKVPPRIGLRGTAQIFGDKVSLGFYLFRKPISAVRQYLGL